MPECAGKITEHHAHESEHGWWRAGGKDAHKSAVRQQDGSYRVHPKLIAGARGAGNVCCVLASMMPRMKHMSGCDRP